MTLRPTRRSALVVLAAVAALVGPLAAPASAAPAAAPAAGSYVNPVSRDLGDTYADPAVVRGRDGWWYAYATTDPLRSGEGVFHRIPMSRSRDLVDWDYLGDAFPPGAAGLPSWAAADAALWAPDVRYVAGRWVMYYVVTQTTVHPGPNDNAIGVATAPTPAGPWTDSGAPVVGPRPGDSGNPDDFLWTFDPAHLVAADGRQYLYYGSYYGGVFADRADRGRHPDGRRADHGRDRQPLRGRVRRAAATAGTTCSPRPATAAPARSPATASSSAGRAARSARSSTSRRRLAARRPAPAAASWSPRTATAGSAPATTRWSPTRRPGLARLPRDRPRDGRSWTSRSASTGGRC